jgi:Domain of unknown function (DUF5122) beta-propeller
MIEPALLVNWSPDDQHRTDRRRASAMVIVGGSAVSPVTRSDFALARYTKDGSLDPIFDRNGMTTTDFFGANDFCFGLAVQPDGRTVAVGRAFVVDRDIAVARYLAR